MSKVGGITCQLLKGTKKKRCIISLLSLKIWLVSRTHGSFFIVFKFREACETKI